MGERRLGDYLHALRIEKKKTLRTAAKEMEISAMYLSEIESGKKIPSGQMIKKIADYYQESYIQLAKLGNESSEGNYRTSAAAVARMVEGLSEENLKKVFDYIQNIENGGND